MKRGLSIREQFLMRKEARELLLDFLLSTDMWLPGEMKDFRNLRSSDVINRGMPMAPKRSKKQLQEIAKHLPGTVSARIPSRGRLGEKAQHLETSTLRNHFFDLLRQSAKGQPPTEKQLEVLISALNGPITAVTYSPHFPNPYIVSSASTGRTDAQNLVRYLNLIAHCGPIHGLCAQCEAMFILEKGNRRFCAECSKQRQTYQGRKEYLRKKRQEYYWAEKAEAETYKMKSKGKTHGKT